jgi:hypothetical protein
LPAEDSTDDLAEVNEAIDNLMADRYERGLFRGDAGTVRFESMMARLEARAEELRVLPQLPARREYVLSDDRIYERWAALADDHARGDLLRSLGVAVYVTHDQGDEHATVSVELGALAEIIRWQRNAGN